MTQDSALRTQDSNAKSRWRLWLGFGLVIVAVGSFIASFFVQWNDVLRRLQEERSQIADRAAEQPLLASLLYLCSYAAFAGLALPGAPILTLLGGAIFGLWWGLVLVSFGSTSGAALAFL